MKLYKITATEAECTLTQYAGSSNAAAAVRKDFVGQGFKRAQITTEQVEVPVSKTGLLEFLNASVA